jgi:ketosteroid isomerase-like protein
LSRRDLGVLEAVLAPDARWRAVEDGPWNCESRAAVLDVMARNLGRGPSGRIEDVPAVGDRVIVAFRPDRQEPGGWPLEDGPRHVVLTVAGGQVTVMKSCATRAAALAYATAS